MEIDLNNMKVDPGSGIGGSYIMTYGFDTKGKPLVDLVYSEVHILYIIREIFIDKRSLTKQDVTRLKKAFTYTILLKFLYDLEDTRYWRGKNELFSKLIVTFISFSVYLTVTNTKPTYISSIARDHALMDNDKAFIHTAKREAKDLAQIVKILPSLDKEVKRVLLRFVELCDSVAPIDKNDKEAIIRQIKQS